MYIFSKYLWFRTFRVKPIRIHHKKYDKAKKINGKKWYEIKILKKSYKILRNFIRNLQKTGKKINWLEGTRPLVRAIFWAHLGINQNCFTSKRFSEIKNTYRCRLVLIRMIYANFAWLSRPFLYSLAFAKFVLHHTRKDSVLLRYPVSC